MGDIKLIRKSRSSGTLKKIQHTPFNSERQLQRFFEHNLEALLKVRFLETEFKVSDIRIDTIGVDFQNRPVIIEYKLGREDRFIDQVMKYKYRLSNKKAEFALLASEKLNVKSHMLRWEGLRLIMIAQEFVAHYESEDIGNLNAELYRYRFFGDEYLVLESIGKSRNDIVDSRERSDTGGGRREPISDLDPSILEFTARIFTKQGTDVNERELKHYRAYSCGLNNKNFGSIQSLRKKLLVCVELDPRTIKEEIGFIRDVSNIGHLGCGNVEITIKSIEDAKLAEEYISQAYAVARKRPISVVRKPTSSGRTRTRLKTQPSGKNVWSKISGSRIEELTKLLDEKISDLGNDVTRDEGSEWRHYVIRGRRFACVVPRPAKNLVRIVVNLEESEVEFEEGFTRSVKHIGHWGAGDVEVTVAPTDDMGRAIELIKRAFRKDE